MIDVMRDYTLLAEWGDTLLLGTSEGNVILTERLEFDRLRPEQVMSPKKTHLTYVRAVGRSETGPMVSLRIPFRVYRDDHSGHEVKVSFIPRDHQWFVHEA